MLARLDTFLNFILLRIPKHFFSLNSLPGRQFVLPACFQMKKRVLQTKIWAKKLMIKGVLTLEEAIFNADTQTARGIKKNGDCGL